jgi:hypothetical protein
VRSTSTLAASVDRSLRVVATVRISERDENILNFIATIKKEDIIEYLYRYNLIIMLVTPGTHSQHSYNNHCDAKLPIDIIILMSIVKSYKIKITIPAALVQLQLQLPALEQLDFGT